jgi:hypothetical protein
VLHIRNAEEEGLEVLRAAGLPPYWPVHRHCFTANWPAASAWLELYPGSRLGGTVASLGGAGPGKLGRRLVLPSGDLQCHRLIARAAAVGAIEGRKTSFQSLALTYL